jgi:hypothetical protein
MPIAVRHRMRSRRGMSLKWFHFPRRRKRAILKSVSDHLHSSNAESFLAVLIYKKEDVTRDVHGKRRSEFTFYPLTMFEQTMLG